MDISLKKRITGILLLIGLGLIIIPLFFSRQAPSDEMQLSGSIPRAPAKPRDIRLAIPDAQETTPSPAPASRIVFEKKQSELAGTPAVPANPSPTPLPATAGLPPQTTTQQPPLQTASVTSMNAQLPATTTTSTATVSTPKAPAAVATVSANTVRNQSKVAPSSVSASSGAWVVQLGSFSDKMNAEKLMKKLQAKGFAAYSHSIKTPQGATLIKVVAGPYLQRNEADNAQLKIQQAFNLKGIVVKTK